MSKDIDKRAPSGNALVYVDARVYLVRQEQAMHREGYLSSFPIG